MSGGARSSGAGAHSAERDSRRPAHVAPARSVDEGLRGQRAAQPCSCVLVGARGAKGRVGRRPPRPPRTFEHGACQ